MLPVQKSLQQCLLDSTQYSTDQLLLPLTAVTHSCTIRFLLLSAEILFICKQVASPPPPLLVVIPQSKVLCAMPSHAILFSFSFSFCRCQSHSLAGWLCNLICCTSSYSSSSSDFPHYFTCLSAVVVGLLVALVVVVLLLFISRPVTLLLYLFHLSLAVLGLLVSACLSVCVNTCDLIAALFPSFLLCLTQPGHRHHHQSEVFCSLIGLAVFITTLHCFLN